jgi:propanediol dehydratase small subunit
MLPRTPKFYLAAAGALMVAGIVGIVTVAAASPKPSASPSGTSNAAQPKAQAYCDSFVNHLASNLGKKPDQVKKAITDSLDQTLADAVKAGDLTQQQADAIKAKRNGKQVCAGALAGIGRGERGAAKAHAGLAEYAKALGISPQELKQDLAAGKTVKDVAASKGMDEATFHNNLVNAVKSDLDPKVASGKLTQQQEDNILARLKTGPLPLWDSPAKRNGAGPGKASPKPSPSATTGG